MDAQQNKIFTAVLIAAIVIGVVLAYFIYSLIRYNKRMLVLQRQYATAEITAMENDRKRIAADLHDDLAPMLAAVKLRINSFDLADSEDQQQLDRTNDTLDDIARRMRAISFDLMPASLKLKGLVVAVGEFLNQLEESTTLQIEFVPPYGSLRLPEETTLHLYRIIQEIVHNTLKHAKATELKIVLQKQPGKLLLVTEDNGVGFPVEEKMKEGSGLGLRSLLNRITLLNANHIFESGRGKGTALLIEIPLQDE